MTEEEFYAVYGSEIMTDNTHTADDFIQMIKELKAITHSENLRNEFDFLIQEMELLKEKKIYRLRQ